jgi:phage baseplate assembly protein gpV
MAVELDEGEQQLRILYIEAGTVTGRLTFDAVSNRIDLEGLEHVQIKTDRAIELEAPQIRIRGDLEVEGEIRHIGGDRMTFVDNHSTGQTRNFWPDDNDDYWDGFRRDEDPDRW